MIDSILQSIEFLERQVAGWASLIAKARESDSSQLDTLKQPLRNVSAGELTYLTASMRLLYAGGRLMDKLIQLEAFYPSFADRADAVRSHAIHSIRKAVSFWRTTDPWEPNFTLDLGPADSFGSELFHYVLVESAGLIPVEQNAGEQDRLLAYAFYLRELGAISQWITGLEAVFFFMKKAVFGENLPVANLRTQNTLRSYVTSDGIFPWMPQISSGQKYAYIDLLHLAGMAIDSKEVMMNIGETLEKAFDALNQREIGADARNLIHRSTAAIAQMGYAPWARAVTDGNHYGENSLVGTSIPINIIPSTGEGACTDIVIAVSSSQIRSPAFRLTTVLRNLRKHLLECPKTKLAVLYSDEWDSKVWNESRGDFETHIGHGLVMIRVDVMNERQTTPIFIQP